MGRVLVRLAAADPAIRLVAAVTIPEDEAIGHDAGGPAGCVKPTGVRIVDHLSAECDVLVEFTNPAGCEAWTRYCGQHRVALVSGTTGIGQAQRAALRSAAEAAPVLWSANMSVGVNLLLHVAADVAARLGEGWDVEITEAHHRHKADAPSGTAKLLLESICRAQGRDPGTTAVHGRAGTPGPRKPGEIGVHALRMGEIVGDHEVCFASSGETISLAHRALSRDTFAAGALRAARWIIGRPPGLYSMQDVLFGGASRP
jgi:4-hydroxy-tetrahydrodipicolinate reductase